MRAQNRVPAITFHSFMSHNSRNDKSHFFQPTNITVMNSSQRRQVPSYNYQPNASTAAFTPASHESARPRRNAFFQPYCTYSYNFSPPVNLPATFFLGQKEERTPNNNQYSSDHCPELPLLCSRPRAHACITYNDVAASRRASV